MEKSHSQNGFSLLELLIAVAVVGILVIAGAPGYNHMISRAKQNEAKTELGQIASLEGPFFSSNATYIDNLAVLGFRQTQSPDSLVYAAGFPGTNNCQDVTTIVPPAGESSAAECLGVPAGVPFNVEQNFVTWDGAGSQSTFYCFIQWKTTNQTLISQYYNNYTNAYNVSMFGKVSTATAFTRCQTSTAGEVIDPVTLAITSGAVNNDVGNISAADGGAKTYQAAAFGCIRGGLNPTTCGAGANTVTNVDIWTINSLGHLFNAQDGM